MLDFLEGLVFYPAELPCPQVETDLVPRERRYISDIMDVRNMRMFQQEFQATRNKISFVFSEEQLRVFREWYREDLIHGGAWFKADWPTLDKDKDVTHRFIGQPRYEWLVGHNPGMIGGGSVTVCKVTATVELYDPRKVGRNRNVYTSKLYPYIFGDDICGEFTVKGMPSVTFADDFASEVSIIGGTIKGGIIDVAFGPDDISSEISVIEGNLQQYKFSSYDMGVDDISSQISIISGEMKSHLLEYNYFEDDIASDNWVIVSGELA